jgi:hypothetical protein
MIYVFEDGAVVYDGNTISEEEKQEADSRIYMRSWQGYQLLVALDGI